MMRKHILISIGMAAVFGSGWIMADDDAVLAPDQVSKVNAVGWSLLKDSLANGDDNIAISPVSIRGAFCPLQYGLAGDTQKEVENVMGDGAVFDRFISQYNKEPNGAKLANCLFVEKNLPLRESFVTAVPGYLLKTADFAANPEGERKDINNWIEKNTNGMIKDMFPPDAFTGRDLQFVSINASMFEGSWRTPFNEELNREDIFHGTQGDVKTTMMFREIWGLAVQRPDSSVVVALSYAKPDRPEETSDICFVAVMPGEGMKLTDFVNKTEWDDLVKSFDRENNTYQEFKLTMPKFTIETPLLDVGSPIQKLGIKDMFDPGKADFSRMTINKGLFAPNIYHKCYIKVFEKGTKAAAVTGVAWAGANPAPKKEMIVTLDRPFLWFIYDQKQSLVLFCGSYSMPVQDE